MYAVLTTFNLGPGMRSAAEKSVDQSNPVIKKLKGFKGATYFGDVEVGEYHSLVIWESKENAEAARAIMAPKVQEAAGSILKAPPTRKVFEVYKPKG
jgi:heme-degrading monooxygenase HmoA